MMKPGPIRTGFDRGDRRAEPSFFLRRQSKISYVGLGSDEAEAAVQERR
jgi:hypothetical protein